MRQYCGARTRQGGRCRLWPLPGKRRCRLHGGRVPGGSRPGERDMRKLWARAAMKRAFLHTLGLKWYGGRPRKRHVVLAMAEEAKGLLEPLVEEARGRGAGELAMKPLEEMTLPEVAGLASLEGVRQLYRIISQPLDFDDPKQMRLVGDMSLGINRLFLRAAESERQGDVLGRLLALIEADKKSG